MAGLWVVIPGYQAEARIGAVVDGALAHGLPVVVVDDGSRDRTAEAATAAGAIVVRHPSNRGKGAALQTGFAVAGRAGAAGVLTLDADGQHDPAELPRLIAAHDQAPEALIIGVRDFDAGMPGRSRFGNRFSTWWISRFTGRPHRDTQSGFRVYPRRLYAETSLRTSRFDTETELLLWAAKRGVPLVEVPIRTIYHADDQSTHFHNFDDSVRIVLLVVGSPFWRG